MRQDRTSVGKCDGRVVHDLEDILFRHLIAGHPAVNIPSPGLVIVTRGQLGWAPGRLSNRSDLSVTWEETHAPGRHASKGFGHLVLERLAHHALQDETRWSSIVCSRPGLGKKAELIENAAEPQRRLRVKARARKLVVSRLLSPGQCRSQSKSTCSWPQTMS